MSESCECDEHGRQLATVVCKHIVETLKDGAPRGFVWSGADDHEYEAVCSECAKLSASAWDKVAVEVGRVLCLECYRGAASANGVVIDQVH